MRKIFWSAFYFIFSLIIFSEEEIKVNFNDYSYKPPVIISGDGEAKKNIATTFIYEPLDQYKIYSRIGYVTSIHLKNNEVLEDFAIGDTTRWLVSPSQNGIYTTIYIKPIYDKITTNLVIKTNERNYHFYLVATSEWHNPIVNFRYPRYENNLVQIQQKKKIEDENNYTKVQLENLNFNYKISKPSYDFAPSQVYDDGEKTVLIMKDSLQETPILFLIDDQSGEEMLVNFRFKNNRIVVDRLFSKAVIRLGKKYLEISKEGDYIRRTHNKNKTSNISRGGF